MMVKQRLATNDLLKSCLYIFGYALECEMPELKASLIGPCKTKLQ
jgi:hypothetical protein